MTRDQRQLQMKENKGGFGYVADGKFGISAWKVTVLPVGLFGETPMLLLLGTSAQVKRIEVGCNMFLAATEVGSLLAR
jgi:alanine dehydrogenase